jgi:hypothetical protein
VREKEGMSVLQSRYWSGAFLALLSVAALSLIGCGAAGCEKAQPATAGPGALPHSMKGYELYSWQEGKGRQGRSGCPTQNWSERSRAIAVV